MFIACLFYDHPYAKFWALVIFIIASITDAYDGYFARKYNMETPQGRFLDPLADKILVLSAFISFAAIGIIDYWMVVLIIFRDAIVTGLRVVMVKHGLKMVTSIVAKIKTTVQVIVIVISLIYLGIPVLKIPYSRLLTDFIANYDVIYYLTLIVALFTAYTGFNYLYTNRNAVKEFFAQN